MANGTTWIIRIVGSIQRGVNVGASFKILFDCYYRTIVGFFLRRGFTIEESRDLAQDTFLRAYKSIKDLNNPASFKPWLFSIATNTYKNEVRRRHTDKGEIEESTRSIEDVSNGMITACDYQTNIHDNLVSKEQVEKLEQALEELPPQARRCIVMWAEQGLKYREIAEVLQISIGTVKSHIYEARRRLKERLGLTSRGSGV